MSAKDCFEAGLFFVATIWGDRAAKPAQYSIAKKKAESALDNLGVPSQFVERVIPEPPVFTNVNERLRWVATKMYVTQQVKHPIENKYGTIGGYCYQVGVDLGNVIFASGIMASAGVNAEFLKPYLDNLKLSAVGIGKSEILENFLNFCEGLPSSSPSGVSLAKVDSRAITCAESLAIWIDVNIHLPPKSKTLCQIIAAFLEGIPWVGKGIAETFRAIVCRER